MPGHEEIEGALVRVGITHQAAAGADGAELGIPAGDQFVGIDLVARVPNEAIVSEVEGQVQGQAQLDHAEVAGEMGRPMLRTRTSSSRISWARS